MIDIQRNLNINETRNFINDIKKYIKNSLNKLSEIENSLENEQSNFVIDRFEGEFAICESIYNKKMVNIKKEKLPIDAKEGMILRHNNGKYIVDQKENNNLKNNIERLVQNLWKN